MAFEIFLNQLKCMYFNISTFDSASLLLGYIYIYINAILKFMFVFCMQNIFKENAF